MRIKIDDLWIAGHPDYEPGEWTPAQNVIWLPTRSGAWQSGAGWERVGYEDAGNPALTLRFDVSRSFDSQREAADWITSLHSRTPPHPWNGEVWVRYDREDGGTVEINMGECVVQMTSPPQSLGGTGRLTQTVGYSIHGGVLGAQPSLTDPDDPDQYNYEDPPVSYY